MEPEQDVPMSPPADPVIPTPPESHLQKKRMNKRLFFIVLVVLVLGGIGYGVYWYLNRPTKHAATVTQNENDNETAPADPTRVRIIATGDFIPHDAINAAAKQSDGSYVYYPMMANMQKYFDKADVRFCNQAVLGAGDPYRISGYPVFNSPTSFASDMAKLGCNVINTGTNHSSDKGQKAIDASISVWDDLPDILAVAGANRSAAEQKAIHYFEVKGIKFAFLSYTSYSNTPPPNSFSINTFDAKLMEQQIGEARAHADIVMVSARWGTEYSQGINTYQGDWAQRIADWGADVILGHGPHFLEPVKQLDTQDGREAIVWFSLGNFINAQLEVEALFNGIAIMDVDIASKKLTNVSYLPIYMHYTWTAAEKKAGDLLARKNFSMYPLDEAAEHLSESLLDTTVEQQTDRITSLLNKYTKVKILSSKEF